MGQVADHLGVAELRAGDRNSKDARLARHGQVAWLRAPGRTGVETARLTGLVPRWVEELLVRHNAFGPCWLDDRRRRNGAKATILRPEILDMLRERLRTPPDDGGVRSAKKVAAVMAAALGLGSLAHRRGWAARQAIGWSIQAPRPRHLRAATLDAQSAFQKRSPRPSPKRRNAIPARRSRPSPPTSTASV